MMDISTSVLLGHDSPDFVRLGSWLSERKLEAGAAFLVPGRIEVMGKHTDYAGGRSLLCAVSHGFSIAVVATGATGATGATESTSVADVEVVNIDTGERDTFRMGSSVTARQGHWSNYPRVAARRLAHNFGADRGARIYFTSNLPIAAGISSSSAFTVGVYLAFAWANRIPERAEFRGAISGLPALGDYLGCLENGRDYPGLPGTSGVGTTGGSEDQTAILCARPEKLRQFSFAPTRFEADAPMPADQTFVVASSGVSAEKTGAALADYNMLGSLGDAAVNAWNKYTGADARHLGDILSRSPFEDLESAIHSYLSDEYPLEWVLARARQFRDETFELIPAAVAALHVGDVAAFGEIMDRSQRGAEEGLRNQIPETIHLVRSARSLGAAAASAFGAGFGGSVWAMVPTTDADDFIAAWSASYASAFPEVAPAAKFFPERPGPPARQLGVDEPEVMLPVVDL